MLCSLRRLHIAWFVLSALPLLGCRRAAQPPTEDVTVKAGNSEKLAPPAPPPRDPSGYQFWMETMLRGQDSVLRVYEAAKPFTPHVVSSSGALLQEGDVIEVGRFLLPLGPPGEYRFRQVRGSGTIGLSMLGKGPTGEQRILQRLIDGKPQTIAVAGQRDFESYGRKAPVDNPLKDLSPEELRALRGVLLDGIDAEVVRALSGLDGERVCVMVRALDVVGSGVTPVLPKGLRCLAMMRVEDFSLLGAIDSLRYLALDSSGIQPFDASVLARNRQLRHLRLSALNPSNLSSLAGLPIRKLEIRVSDLADLSFASALSELEELRLQDTPISDLSPLSALSRLAIVDANGNHVGKLPRGALPALRQLSVLQTESSRRGRVMPGVSDQDAAQFTREHPSCRLIHRWEPALKRELTAVTRLRVRTGGTCHHDGSEKTLIELADRAELTRVIDSIRISDSESGFHCLCCGHPSLEFYRGDELLLTLGFHHGRSLRWATGWPGDAMLTAESGETLSQWMAKRGVKDPLAERRAEDENRAK